MEHICNYCKYNDVCKEKFKEKSGLLCNNKYFQNEIEKKNNVNYRGMDKIAEEICREE